MATTNDITIGSRWTHRNGITYTVYDITNEHSENAHYPVMISYIGQNGKRWSRRAGDWYRSFNRSTEGGATSLAYPL